MACDVMRSRLAPVSADERRLAVIDMGSNTFRLVVFRYRPGGSFQLVNEIRDVVRLSAGAGPEGLSAEAIERASHTTRLYAAFCEAAGVDDVAAVATSAVRDAANAADALDALSAGGALKVRTLSAEEEAWYGYLGTVNSTTLGDGHVLDLGGGSVQISQVVGRKLGRTLSRPLGAVRMTERFLARQRPSRADLKALRKHVARELGEVPWLERSGGRMVGIGGTIRTLAVMHQRRVRYALDEIHGYLLGRDGLEELVNAMAGLPARDRGRLPGLKQDRADITLAGAVVIATALEHLGVEGIEICAQGLREGIFYERFLAPAEPPLIGDVRRQSVENLVNIYRCERTHAERVTDLALAVYDGARAPGHPADGAPRARAALGRGDAARRRGDGGLQRPPQARLLPGAERRPAGLPPTASWRWSPCWCARTARRCRALAARERARPRRRRPADAPGRLPARGRATRARPRRRHPRGADRGPRRDRAPGRARRGRPERGALVGRPRGADVRAGLRPAPRAGRGRGLSARAGNRTSSSRPPRA